MPTFDDFLYWHRYYLAERDLCDYSDLDREVELLKSKVEVSHEFTEEDDYQFSAIVTKNYKRNNEKIIVLLKTEIDTRMTRGQSFAEEHNNLTALSLQNKKDNQGIDKYIEIQDEIRHVGYIIMDKIDVEKFNIIIVGLSIISGLLFAIIGGVIGGYILKLLGVC
jgi:hypothetical protein